MNKTQLKSVIKNEIMVMSNGIIIESNDAVSSNFKKYVDKHFPKSASAAKINSILSRMPQSRIVAAIEALVRQLPKNKNILKEDIQLNEGLISGMKKVLSIAATFKEIKTILGYLGPKIGMSGLDSNPLVIILMLLFFLLKSLKTASDLSSDTLNTLATTGMM